MNTNYTYKVDGVKHVYCVDCVPDVKWRLEMIIAKRLTEWESEISEPCESCGQQPEVK